MKKFKAILIIHLIVSSAICQVQNEYFAPVGWGDQPRNVDFSSEAANESHIIIPNVSQSLGSTIDITNFSTEEIIGIWNSIGDPNLIQGMTSEITDPFDLDENAEGTFGAAWKAFYNAESLFVLFKFVDTESISSDRAFELAIQTKEHERFEAGWEATSILDTSGVGYRYMNDQYGAFRELGGMKLFIDNTGIIVENATSIGSTGSWGSGIGGTSVGDVAVFNEANNTIWLLLQLDFDDLKYYDDVWGDDDVSNYVSMDPVIESIISFEPLARATISEEEEYRAWWNGVNDAYKLIYYRGKIEFGDSNSNSLDNAPTVPSNKIFYCKGETAEALVATGSNLKWYLDEVATTTAPTPSTDQTGVTDFYVTQTIEGEESRAAKIRISVSDYQIVLTDRTIKCGDEILLHATTNYLGSGIESFEWQGEEINSTEIDLLLSPDQNEKINLIATTNTGCATEKKIDILVQASQDSLRISSVTTTLDNKNEIRWPAPEMRNIDSLYIWTRISDSDDSYTSLEAFEYSNSTGLFTDNRASEIQQRSEYTIRLRDMCGNLTESIFAQTDHHPVVLEGAKISERSNYLRWEAYKGRTISNYEVLRGLNDNPSEKIFSTSTSQNYFDISTFTDTMYYRIRTIFTNEYDDASLNKSFSNVIKVFPRDIIYIDTIVYYDTILVTVTDTLIIDTPLGTGSESLSNTIKIYPNPAKDFIYIHTGDYESMDGYTLKILNSLGVEVYSIQIEEQLYLVNLSDWSGLGLYFVHIINEVGETVDVRKIILE